MAQSVIVKNKEIRVKNPQMVVEDENRAELIEFTITNAYSIEDVEGMIFYVQYRNKLGEVGMDTLVNAYPSEIVHNDMLVLDWLPSASFTKERGKIEIQIVGFTESIQPTSDTTYQSGKMYFSDSAGTFLPVYPATSTHSPKVGDTITGTVYENQVTGEDHRWSTEKCQLMLPENIYDNGTPVYTEAQVESLITQIQAELSYAGINALKAEGFAVGEQNGTEVGSGSPYYHNNAKYYNEQAQDASDSASDSATEASGYKTDAENARDKAQDWATKTNGKVDNIDYSAKHYAGEAGDYAEDADNARIVSVSETQSPDDGGTNVVVITYKDGTTFTFFVKNGNAGTPFTIYKTYSSIAEMNADFANVPEGRFVIISSTVSDPDNSKMFVRGAEAFTFVTDLSGAQGIQGPAGQAATITVGTVSTGAAGSSASIVNSGTSSAAVFDFVIPRGDKGEQGIQGIQGEKGDTGNTPVLSIGSVTYGDTPTVTIDTTDPDHPVLNFVLKTSEVGVVDNLNSSSAVDALSAKQGSILKDAIQANSNRITNLEEKADPTGAYKTVNYRGTNDVPTGKAKYALVESIVGKSRAWNQLLDKDNYASTYTENNVTFTNNGDGSVTVSTTAEGASANTVFRLAPSGEDSFQMLAGHRYLMAGCPSGGSSSTYMLYDNYYGRTETGSGYIYNENATRGMVILIRIIAGTIITTPKTFKPIIRDLTLIFPEGVPSTIAECVAKCPDLLKYDAFGTSIVDTTVEGVKSIGFNRLDLASYMQTLGISKSGDYYATSGYEFANKSSANPISGIFDLNTRYSFRLNGYCSSGLTSFKLEIHYTDGTYEQIATIASQSLATGVGTSANGKSISYVNFTYGSGSSNYFYLKSLTISIGTDTTKDADYMNDTLTLPSSVTLRSAGTDFEDMLDVETGEITLKCAEYTITGNELFSFYPSSSASLGNHNGVTFPIPAELSGIRTVLDAVGINDIGLTLQYANNDKTIYVSPSNIVMINDAWTTEATFVQNITGKHLVFALQNFGSTSISPVIDNTIQTEGGGTINTIQTQTPVIDNCMDVGYLAL